MHAVCNAGVALAADDYLIGPGDIIKITVYQEDDLSMEVKIGKSGKITYPFLGEINVRNKTTKQIEVILDKGLRGDYLIQPRILVEVETYRNFYVDGQVNQPGGYPYSPGLTVQKAISTAGGFTERADRDKVKVQSEGASQSKPVTSLSSVIKPGDIVTVGESFF